MHPQSCAVCSILFTYRLITFSGHSRTIVQAGKQRWHGYAMLPGRVKS
jgi:hypothetical protein